MPDVCRTNLKSEKFVLALAHTGVLAAARLERVARRKPATRLQLPCVTQSLLVICREALKQTSGRFVFLRDLLRQRQ